MGKLVGIATRATLDGPMASHERAAVCQGSGLEGDSRGAVAGRQVTVLSREAWEATCAHLGRDEPWTARRANLLLEGLDLRDTEGLRLRIGGVELEITGETRPCAHIGVRVPGLTRALALDWRGGITCDVVRGGELTVGDEARLAEPDEVQR